MKNKNIEQGKQLVVQSNPLVEAQYRLDMVAQKVLRYIISMITPYDETLEKKFYRIQIKEFEEFLGWQKPGEIFQYIKRVADRLKATTIRVKKPGTTIVTSWIASYEYPENKGWIEFELSSKLESELLQLKKQFTQYYLKNISKLKSQYSIRLYELLRQYVSAVKRILSIDEIRAVCGIDKSEFKLYGDLKKRVIIPAYKEINQKTDLNFKFEEIKEARKVIGIIFYDIEQKTFISNRVLSLVPREHQENKQVLNIIRKYLNLFGKDYVVEKLNYTNSRHPKRWTDYFFKACEYNYGEGYTPNQDNETYIFVEDPETRAAAEKRKREKELIKKIEDEYSDHKEKTVKAYLASLSASELEEIKKGFEKSLNNNFLKTMFKENGFDSLMIQGEYAQFVYENHIPPEARLSLLDFSKKSGYAVDENNKEEMGP